jgi:hypothetical protein
VKEVSGWRKSSFSGHGSNECVEVSSTGETVSIRDSKDPNGPVLVFDSAAWAEFIQAIKRGELGNSDT